MVILPPSENCVKMRRYKHTPSQLLLFDKIDREQLAADIMAECLWLRERRNTKREYHNEIQESISLLAKKYGLGRRPEFPIKEYMNGMNGRLDVVWYRSGLPIVAFEIDSGQKFRSVKKLIEIQCEYKYWIYYGESEPDEFLKSIQGSEVIHVEEFLINGLQGKPGYKSCKRKYKSKMIYYTKVYMPFYNLLM